MHALVSMCKLQKPDVLRNGMCGCIGVAEEGTRRYVLLLRITLAERRGHEVIINIYTYRHTPLFIYSTCDVKKIVVFLAP